VNLKLPHEPDRAGGRLDDLARVASRLVGKVVAHREQVPVTGDGGEQIVQVVRDRAERRKIALLANCEEMGHGQCFGRTGGAL
jgi:transcription antitermination factor NusA-like protein